MAAKLTMKQEKFCVTYVKTGNATEAYKIAYATKNMKPQTINRKAKELIDNGKITARTAELLAPVYDKLEVTAEKTLKRLMQGQEFDIRKLYKENGSLKKIHELDEDTAKALVGVTLDGEGQIVNYKTLDVKGCAELVGKNLKLFTEKYELTGKEGSKLFEDKYTDKELEAELKARGLGNFID